MNLSTRSNIFVLFQYLASLIDIFKLETESDPHFSRHGLSYIMSVASPKKNCQKNSTKSQDSAARIVRSFGHEASELPADSRSFATAGRCPRCHLAIAWCTSTTSKSHSAAGRCDCDFGIVRSKVKCAIAAMSD